jgi:hypothetical protein
VSVLDESWHVELEPGIPPVSLAHGFAVDVLATHIAARMAELGQSNGPPPGRHPTRA